MNAKSCSPLSKNPRCSFAVHGTSLKSLINSILDFYISHSKDIVGEAYAFMVFHPISTKKLNIFVVLFCMQSIKQIHCNSKLIQLKSEPLSFCKKNKIRYYSQANS